MFFFKQKSAYEMRISDWSSDVCSSDLASGCFITQFLGRDSDMVEAREAFIFGRGQHDDAGGAVALDPDGVRHGFVVIEAEALRNLTGSDLFDWQFHDSLIIFIVMLAN